MASNHQGPLYGRPPFATNVPDNAYDNTFNDNHRRLRPQNQAPRPTSAYNVYDNYVDEKQARQSGYGDVGADLLNGDMDDDSDDETIAVHGDLKRSPSDEKIPPPPAFDSRRYQQQPQQNQNNIPIAAPRPGYAAPVSALTMPEPAATPVGQPRAQYGGPPQMQQQRGPAPAPSFPQSMNAMPNAPHPLQPPQTPITPAFARPPKPAKIEFDEAIMRGQKEDVPLGRRQGNNRDDFWRRFSMVVKEEGGRKNTSSWLEKTQSSSASMSRLVWLVGILLLIIIGGAIGFGIYISRNSNPSSPRALGGSENQGASFHPTSTAAGGVAAATSSGVMPTATVAKRHADPWPAPEPMVIHAVHKNASFAKRHLRNKRRIFDLD